MAFVLAARWTAREGEEESVASALRSLGEATRKEPGCIMWVPNRDPENPGSFLIYEQYEDKAAFEAHGASEHFKRLALEGAIPLLESRERAFYETL
ncbi:MAG: putative quinol monooxygenase [Gaiellaceae bacterium]